VLGYTVAEIAEIEAYAVGHGSLAQAPGVNHTSLKARAFPMLRSPRSKARWARPSTSSSCSTAGRWAMTSAIDVLGFTDEQLNDPTFDMLSAHWL
jgi:ribonucleoside-diphosphate reductase alpha chain